MLVIKNCKFVPELTEDVDFVSGDIVLADGKISDILPSGVNMWQGADILDAQGATLLPGLIDMHIHLMNSGKSTYAELLIERSVDRVFECYRSARTLLDYGYTTLRDCGDDTDGPAMALGRAIDKGIVVGPNISACGGMICPREPGAEIVGYSCNWVNGPINMRDIARRNFEIGADFLKIYGTGSLGAKGSEPGLRILDEDEIREAVAVAGLKNSYVAIHCHGSEAIDTAVRCGVRTIEHASLITDDTIDYIVGHSSEHGIVPTLSVFYATMANSLASLSTSSDFYADRAKKLRDNVRTSITHAYQSGMLVGWGRDLTTLTEWLEKPYEEFRLRKEEIGCSNLDILKQVTINSAKLMKWDDRVGSLKIGKYADCILVDGDPVADISVMYQKPLHVIKAGEIIR